MKTFIRFLCITFFLAFSGCKAFSLDSVPYVISGDFEMEDGSADYSICGVNFYLLNQHEKDISKITIVFFLFDQDGEPAWQCRSKISAEVMLNLESGESTNFCISLDQFMNSVPEELLLVDYLYLAKIEYEDGSVWEDPYGLTAFR